MPSRYAWVVRSKDILIQGELKRSKLKVRVA
jgi:hypothetical protein